jgi:predicted Holliday junction resolvase-like endonuclease
MDTSLLVIIGIVIVILLYQVIALKRKEDALKKEVVRLEGTISDIEGKIHTEVQERFQLWQQKECDSIRVQQIDIARREAITQLESWKYENEILIRHDAIQRSQSVIVGKVTEHLIPYLPNFIFNPKDTRFIGSPVDLLVFDGLDNGHLNKIVFIEVKTGTAARLTRREQQIKDAINEGRVEWLKLRVKHEKEVE